MIQQDISLKLISIIANLTIFNDCLDRDAMLRVAVTLGFNGFRGSLVLVCPCPREQ